MIPKKYIKIWANQKIKMLNYLISEGITNKLELKNYIEKRFLTLV